MSRLQLDRIDLTRSGRAVLRGVSVAFAPGRLTAVIGPNGAGKSSLLAIAAGVLTPSAGAVSLEEVPLFALSRGMLARRRAYLPQRAAVEWPITVERVVALGHTPSLPAFGGMPEAFRSAIEKAIETCDLGALRDRPATELSGGELGRVMLARAIVGDPELLIVDEPTAGLDPRHALDTMQRLRARAEAGRTVIVAIHEIDLALRFADDIVAIRHGGVAAVGPAGEVLTEAMLSALYDVRAEVRRDSAGVTVRFST